MIFIMKKLLRKIGKFLPTKLVLYIDYGRSYKKILNLSNPQYYGEKIQWIKLNGRLERFCKFADKYEVRKYIEDKVGNQYLNKIYGLYNNPNEIDFEQLPERFVIKIINGTGKTIICKDRKKLDIQNTVKTLKKWQREKFYKYTKEIQYKNIPNKIICEEYLEDETGNLSDYKFHCSKGNVYIIEAHTNRYFNHRENYYDINWNEFGITAKVKKGQIEKPKKLPEMIEIAKVLSKDFPYVRVDLYLVNEKIYFGELTFTPANGTDAYYPLEKDLEFAKIINIDDYMNISFE